jgi:hypothetical protein
MVSASVFRSRFGRAASVFDSSRCRPSVPAPKELRPAASFASEHPAEPAGARPRSFPVRPRELAKLFAAARWGVSQGGQLEVVSKPILSFDLSWLAPVSSRPEEESAAAALFVWGHRAESAGTRPRWSQVRRWASAKQFAAARSGVSREGQSAMVPMGVRSRSKELSLVPVALCVVESLQAAAMASRSAWD